MRFGLFAIVALTVALVSSSASAQSGIGGLPSERELNRLGLTLSWWSQAGLGTNQNEVSHFWNDEQGVYLQTKLGTFITFDGESGKRNWSRLIGSPFQANLAGTSNETEIIVTSGTSVLGFDKLRGTLLWQIPVPSYPSSSPRADFGILYFCGSDGMIRAYDTDHLSTLFLKGQLPQAVNRALLWHYQLPAPATSEAFPMSSGVIFTSEAGFIYRVNGRELDMQFKSELGSKISAPTVYSYEDSIISQSDSRMVKVDNQTGTVKWVTTSGTPLRTQPFLIKNDLYIEAPRDGISKLNAQDGGMRIWQQPRAISILAISETKVYATDNQSNLLIIDNSTGQVVSRMSLGDFKHRVNNHRTDRIFMANSRGTVVCLRELDSQFPAFHLYPERRPILPEFAEDDESESEIEF